MSKKIKTILEMKKAVEEFKNKFTPGFYHASPSPDIKEFDSLKSPKGPEEVTPGVTFAARNPKFANSLLPDTFDEVTNTMVHPFDPGSTIYPVSIDMSNHFDPKTKEGQAVLADFVRQKFLSGENPDKKAAAKFLTNISDPHSNWTTMEGTDFLDYLRNTGHKSFEVRESGFKNVGVFEPQNIRGKFAEYNPEEAANPDFMKAEGGAVGGLDHLAGGGIPKKVVKAYKLFKTKGGNTDELYPLFVNANKPVPLNEWVNAEVGPVAASGKVKSKLGELAYRPGWHAGDLPVATHIGGKSAPDLKAPDFRRPDEVWAEVEMPDDVAWQEIANQRARLNKAGKPIASTAHITDAIPEGGFYRYKTSPNMEGNWLIGGGMKVNRVLTDEEVQAINDAAGVADLPRFTKFDEKAEGGVVEGYDKGGKVGFAIELAKKIAPKFNLEAIKNMPVSSAQKQTPVARAFEMLSSENVDPKVKQQIFKQYVQSHPDLVRKSGATNYDELTQAAYQQMGKETRDQFQAIEGAGVKLSWDPTGAQGYKSSKEMLEDALENKHLMVFQGGEAHPALGKEGNEQFRAAHDYFGHGTTGASFGPKGEELAYGAHSQMYSPLARLAAATETRGQNSLVSYSGMNEELINAMNQLKTQRDQLVKSGGDPSDINNELLKLGQQFQYAPQKPLILPPEQIDINYKGYAAGGAIKAAKRALEHAKSVPFVHYSKAPNISTLDPNMYGTGIKGAESGRLKNAPDIRPRSYIYTKAGGRQPEQGLGPHKYEGVAEDLYPLHDDPMGFSAIAKERALDPYMMQFGREVVDEATHLNELERLIKKAGYKGYANDDVGLLFDPTPVIKSE